MTREDLSHRCPGLATRVRPAPLQDPPRTPTPPGNGPAPAESSHGIFNTAQYAGKDTATLKQWHFPNIVLGKNTPMFSRVISDFVTFRFMKVVKGNL